MARASETGHRRFQLSRQDGVLRLQNGQSADLEQLLVELALVLLPRGITPKTFSKLARGAFIRAAAERSRLRNGRINRSKVAALTGLTRREVKRALDSSETRPAWHRSTQVPCDRVIQGWLTDRRFTTKQGRPKMLATSGAVSSFQKLVKDYGGDISPRAVLEQLEQSRVVRSVGRRVALRATKMSSPKVRMGDIARIIPALIDGLRIASVESTSASGPMLYRLRLPASSELELALIRDRCASGVQSLLHGLDASLKYPIAIPGSKRRPLHALNLTVILADAPNGRASDNDVVTR